MICFSIPASKSGAYQSKAFYKNPDVVHDFVDRSLHTGVVVGKDITQQYYGQAHNKSYYLGCSTGGRQGFEAVQNYPDDFDGVIAGAPVSLNLEIDQRRKA